MAWCNMNDLKVFIANREATCAECGEELGHHAWITLVENKGAVCLACADLDHLVFLPAGDACVTRRARQSSHLSAVVLEWSRSRKRYERQGLLVEASALDQAEQECLADADARARHREREAVYRQELDEQYVQEFARHVRQLFPALPPGRETAIAEHACLKYSDRVGRSAAAKDFDENAVRLAVMAHARHTETRYDDLLSKGVDRWDAREQVKDDVYEAMRRWQRG